MRIYDPRVGRFLSVDSLTKQYPHYTPYSFAGNKPIVAIDLDGEEEKHYALKHNGATGKNVLAHLGDVDLIEKKTSYERKAVHGEQGEVIGRQWMPSTRTAKNERVEYVCHEVQNITLGVSGPPIATELTWSFPTSGEMENVVGGGELNWYSSNEKTDVYKTLAIYAALEAEAEVGGAKGLWAGKQVIRAKSTTAQEGVGFFFKSTKVVDGKITVPGEGAVNGQFDFIVTMGGKLNIGRGHFNLSGGSMNVQAAGHMPIKNG